MYVHIYILRVCVARPARPARVLKIYKSNCPLIFEKLQELSTRGPQWPAPFLARLTSLAYPRTSLPRPHGYLAWGSQRFPDSVTASLPASHGLPTASSPWACSSTFLQEGQVPYKSVSQQG